MQMINDGHCHAFQHTLLRTLVLFCLLSFIFLYNLCKAFSAVVENVSHLPAWYIYFITLLQRNPYIYAKKGEKKPIMMQQIQTPEKM